MFFFFFSSRRRHTRYIGDWSSDVCSSDLFLQQMRHLVSPFPPVGSVAAPFGSPAVPHLRWYYGVVRLLVHPSSVASRSEERRVGKECSSRWRRYLSRQRRATDASICESVR